ncbi:MAG TPA: AAA family ATPase [Actinomycetota bacterium]|nr:AAA family ATPase [Actinomycetota bacterium]
MSDKSSASPATILEGSHLTTSGTADVFRQRERTRMKKVLRAIAVVFVIDAFLWRWYATGHRIGMPKFGPEFIYFLPVIGIFIAIFLMAAIPLISGRSPHITVYPEQVEFGLSDIKGLDTQVDEVIRTIDVFLGYATFREELGGTPRRGILFEGPPGTGKTFLAKAMAKQAGVPFMFISAPAFQSMWQGMTAFRIRSFFKALRKAARKEGGAIGFIEEIDAIGATRGGMDGMSPAPPEKAAELGDMGRVTSAFIGGGGGGMVNELLIQMQSFDQPPWRDRMKAKLITFVNGYLPPDRQFTAMRPEYNNILLIAATNRGDALDPALLRPGRFDRRLFFDAPTKQERRDLIDFFLARKAHHEELDEEVNRERIAHESFGYTPVMIEHLFDEALLVALRDGRKQMTFADVMEAKFTEEIGTKQPTVYTDTDRDAVATHEAGHATVAYLLGKGRRLEVLSIIKRRGSLGLLAHSDEEERLTRTKSEIEAGIAIALGGLVAEELCYGESGTGPGADLAHATSLAAQMVGSFGMAGSLISYEAVADGPLSRSNLVGKVLANPETKQRVEDILEAQRERVREVLDANRDVHGALRDALIERDELVRDEILDVIEKALANRA